MQIGDGGGSSRKPSSTPVQKPAPTATPARNAGSLFALKNAGGARTTSATSRTDGVRAPTPYSAGSKFALKNDGGAGKPTPSASAYRPGSKFALKNDGGVQKPGPAASERPRAAGDGVRVATPYRPGSLFALKNDGTAGGTARPGFTDREALAVAGNVHDAMYGELIGTRKGQAFAALRGLSPAEVRQVAYQYEVKYSGRDPEQTPLAEFQVQGSLLYTRLKGKLEANVAIGATGRDWAQAQALLRGDTAKADAIALQTALDRPWLVPGGRENEILTVLRRAEPAERQALVEAFAQDFAGRDHTVVRGMAGATQVPGTEMAQHDKDPATLVMNVLKTQLGGGDWTEAVGLITAAKYSGQPAVAARAQGEATVGRLYSLLDRPFPDRAAALQVLQGLGPAERTFVQGLATGQAEPTKLGQLLQGKLTDSEFQQATAYLQGDTASAKATALHEALTRTSPTYGYPQPTPDVAAAEKILGEIGSDDERRTLLAAFEQQYHQDAASLVPAVVPTSRREVLIAQLRTAPSVLDSGASTLAGLGGEAVETGIDYRANVLRTAIESRLLGVAEDDVRRAFADLDAAQARALASQPLRPGEPNGRTLGDELGQWYRAGGGGRFTLELQQMLDGDASATGDRRQQIDEAQAQYNLETTGPLVGVNDAIQRLFGNDARTVLDADAARLQAADAALRASRAADEPARADMAVAYMGTGLRDYRTAKEATTEAAKTVVTTAAVVGTTIATAGTAAAVWAPVVAGAAANAAATQLNGASNSWQDDAVAVVEGAANGLTLPGSAVTVRGGQYVVREAAVQGGQQVFRSVSRSVAQDAVERGLAEGAEEVLARGGRVVLRDAGRELSVQAFRPTVAQAIGQNVAEGVAGSIVGDVAAGTLRGEVNPQQVATNAVFAAGTAGLLGLGMAGASRLAERLRGAGATPGGQDLPAEFFGKKTDGTEAWVRDGAMELVEPTGKTIRVGTYVSKGEVPETRYQLWVKPAEGKLGYVGEISPEAAQRVKERFLSKHFGDSWSELGSDVYVVEGGRPSPGGAAAGPPSGATTSPDLAEGSGSDAAAGHEFLTREERGAIGRAAQFGDEAAQKILLEDYVARHPELDSPTADLLRNPPPPELSGLSGHDAVLASMVTGNTSLGRYWYAETRGVMKDAVSPLTQVAMKVHGEGGAPEEVNRIVALGMRLAQPLEDRAGVRYMRAQYLKDLEEADRLISAHLPDRGDLLRRINAVLDEGKAPAPSVPPEAADATMQTAFVRAMRRTDVAEIGIRSSDPESRAWHFVGGSTLHDAEGRVMGPSAPPLAEPQIVDGRPVFPEHPQQGTGAIFPTKPGGTFPWTENAPAVALSSEVVESMNAALAAEGKSLYDLYPDLSIPRLVTPPGGGEPVWVQQLSLGGAKPVVADPVRDAAGKVVGGRVLMAVPDVDVAYARAADGHLLTDAEIMGPNGLKAAINRAYAELGSPGTEYEIVNHGAHFNALQDPDLVKAYGLDAPEYWDGQKGRVHKFTLDEGGYVETTQLGETYRKLVDPTYVPTWQRGGDGPAGVGRGPGGSGPVPGAGPRGPGASPPAAPRTPRTPLEGGLATLRHEVASGARPMRTLDDLKEALSEIAARDPKGLAQEWVQAQTKRDANFLPSLLNSVSPYPDLKFNEPLRLRLDRFEAPVFRSVETSGEPRVQAEVKTSLASLVGGDPAFAAFRETYATTDVPLTIRVNLPERAPHTVGEVNRALESAPTVNWFMHGYQSNRTVWEPELARWDDLVDGDSISIAVGGMGAEGHFAGTGASPLTPKQYAFQMLSAMDLLGLGGKQKVNVIGHSMGGAAAYEMGRALADRVAAGLPGEPPPMSFVLLAPALAPDSVSFLHHPFYGSLIRLENRVGSQAPATLMDLVGKTGVPAAVVDSLLPGAPRSIREIHAGFNDFAQLRATAQGLLSQPNPDPLEVQAFLERFPTLVVAAGDDRLVDPRVVQRVFGQENVLLLEGRNHYPHLPQNGVLGEGGQRLLEAARAVLNRTREKGVRE